MRLIILVLWIGARVFAGNFNDISPSTSDEIASLNNVLSKNTEVYVPDRPLPKDKDGVFIPETDAPHTQLGTKKGSKGIYPQAREFDQNSNPVRDIDFTDHCRPQNHPNPHQHEHVPNQTGGTPERSKIPEPVIGWNY